MRMRLGYPSLQAEMLRGGLCESRRPAGLPVTDDPESPVSVCAGQVEAGAFFRAADVESALAQAGAIPAFAGERFEPGQFLIAGRGGFDNRHLTGIAQGDQAVAREHDLSGAKPGLFPFHGTGFGVDALERRVLEFLEADNTLLSFPSRALCIRKD